MVVQDPTILQRAGDIELPRRKRWTRSEYHQVGEMGLLAGRYELIDGEILEKMPKNPPPRIALVLVAVWLESVFGRLFVQSQDPVVIPVPDEYSTEPEPDFAVTRAQITTYVADNPGSDDILLVGEVSDSTLEYDLHIKANLYAAAGIPEYWVVDVTGRRIHIHRMPSSEGYREVRICTEDELVATKARPDVAVLVASLLPAA